MFRPIEPAQSRRLDRAAVVGAHATGMDERKSDSRVRMAGSARTHSRQRAEAKAAERAAGWSMW
jgi:hypothetical protein